MYPAFEDEVLTFLFKSKVPNIDFTTISTVGASLIDHLFKFLNVGTLEFHINTTTNVETFVVKDQNFNGLDYIWRLAVESESQEVLLFVFQLTFSQVKHLRSAQMQLSS